MPDTTVTVVGNCTSNPEIRVAGQGNAVVPFSIAVNSRRKNKDTGEWENGETSFYDIVCFGKLAENVADSVHKGTRVVVTGALRQSSWEKDGQKRTKVEVVAEEVGISLRWDAVSSGAPSLPRQQKPVIDEEPF